MSDLQANVGEVDDPETIKLVEELALIAQLDLEQGRSMQLFHFLQQAVYPNGASEKAVPVDKRDLDSVDPLDSFIL